MKWYPNNGENIPPPEVRILIYDPRYRTGDPGRLKIIRGDELIAPGGFRFPNAEKWAYLPDPGHD